jgi:hypothetical protein
MPKPLKESNDVTVISRNKILLNSTVTEKMSEKQAHDELRTLKEKKAKP